jgi:hypothetical protein
MGQELQCKLHFHRRTISGTVQLETDHLLFRGPERLKILVKDLTGVTAEHGVLHLEFPGGPAAFDLGAAAEKWARKILHPPSRLDKLGVKAGLRVSLAGKFEAGFLEELREHQPEMADGQADLVFFAAEKTANLARVPKLSGRLKPNGALWVVYPKGVADIREIEVIEAGRAAGLKDTKVASFSPTHTALKFVWPVRLR